MQIDRILYPINTLGPGNRIGIWTIGCPHHCKKCSNPELWHKDKEKNINVDSIIEYIKNYNTIADGITITGGDPFYQADELNFLLSKLRSIGFNDILVYTGYKYEFLLRKYNYILSLIDVLIDGKYIDELNDNIGIRGSLNQRIIILNNSLGEKYKKTSVIERERQNFIYKGNVISVGIPNKL